MGDIKAESYRRILQDGLVGGESMEIRDSRDGRYLASTTGQSISSSSTYIVFVTKMQKGKLGKMNLPY